MDALPYIAIALGLIASAIALYVLHRQDRIEQHVRATHSELNGQASKIEKEIKRALAAGHNVL